jgi:hypothetical protein
MKYDTYYVIESNIKRNTTYPTVDNMLSYIDLGNYITISASLKAELNTLGQKG